MFLRHFGAKTPNTTDEAASPSHSKRVANTGPRMAGGMELTRTNTWQRFGANLAQKRRC